MTIQKYSIEEALDRIYRVWKGSTPSDDSPFSLDGEKLTWNEAISRLAELMQNSLPGETLTLPANAVISTGSFTVAHDVLHANGIGAQKLGNAASHVQIEDNGNVTLVGDATQFTDINTPATRIRQGATAKPDFDTDDIGLLFPQNDPNEVAYILIQMKHEKKLDSVIYPHVHYIQAEVAQPTFVYYYRYYNPDSEIPAGWQTGTTADGNKGIFDYVTGSISQIATFPSVTPPANESVSALMDIKLFRNDNDVTGDVLLKDFDIHIEMDGFGSDEQYSK